MFLCIFDRYGQILCSYLFLASKDRFSVLIHFDRYGKKNSLFLFILASTDKSSVLIYFLPIRTNSLFLFIFDRYGQIHCSCSNKNCEQLF